jgi:hypothetical protein
VLSFRVQQQTVCSSTGFSSRQCDLLQSSAADSVLSFRVQQQTVCSSSGFSSRQYALLQGSAADNVLSFRPGFSSGQWSPHMPLNSTVDSSSRSSQYSQWSPEAVHVILIVHHLRPPVLCSGIFSFRSTGCLRLFGMPTLNITCGFEEINCAYLRF